MALNEKQQAANWQEDATAPKPVKHVTPVKIDLQNAGVQYEDGKIVAITGTLCVVPHTASQFPPLAAFFKTGPIECQLQDNHRGNTLSVNFALIRSRPTQEGVPEVESKPTLVTTPVTPSAVDLDSVESEKIAKVKTQEGFEEAVQFVMVRHHYPRGAAESVVAEFGVSDILNDKKIWSIEERLKDASGEPEATKTDGNGAPQPRQPVQQEQGSDQNESPAAT